MLISCDQPPAFPIAEPKMKQMIYEMIVIESQLSQVSKESLDSVRQLYNDQMFALLDIEMWQMDSCIRQLNRYPDLSFRYFSEARDSLQAAATQAISRKYGK